MEIKTNEIPLFTTLLGRIDLTDAVVTADALCRARHNASRGYPFKRSTLERWLTRVLAVHYPRSAGEFQAWFRTMRTAWTTWSGCAGPRPRRPAGIRLPWNALPRTAYGEYLTWTPPLKWIPPNASYADFGVMPIGSEGPLSVGGDRVREVGIIRGSPGTR